VNTEALLTHGAIQAMVRRAAGAAGCPVSLHGLDNSGETPYLHEGQCAACRLVATRAEGRDACARARQTVARRALEQDRPIAGECHLGFGIVCAPLGAIAPGAVLTFGPFVPPNEEAAVESDAHAGLQALGLSPPDTVPQLLADIRRAPPASIRTITRWLQDDLTRLFAEQIAVPQGEAATADPSPRQQPRKTPRRRAHDHSPGAVDYSGNALAAAVAARSRKQARALLLGILAEGGPKLNRPNAVRSRLAAAIAAAAEVCATAGLEIAPVLDALGGFASGKDADPPELLARQAVNILFLATRTEGLPKPLPLGYEPLNKLVETHLLTGLPLSLAAEMLGKTPSAITKHLQRHFGMSYSTYVGRFRVERAKELLRRTRLSATEVARRVGISDQSNFGKLFVRFTGMTPVEYRKLHGKKRK